MAHRYAFPPLLKQVIAADVGMSDSQVLTSNIIALLATLLVRLVAGTCCDRFGARWTFAGKYHAPLGHSRRALTAHRMPFDWSYTNLPRWHRQELLGGMRAAILRWYSGW